MNLYYFFLKSKNGIKYWTTLPTENTIIIDAIPIFPPSKKPHEKATASIKRRGTKGKCTPITKKGCTGRAKALAKTFKKMAKKRKG